MSQATRYRDEVVMNMERGQIRKTRSTDHSKREMRDLRMFQEGAAFGARMRMQMLHNSVRGLDYGAAYYVPPTVDPSVAVGPVDDVDRSASDILDRPSESDTLPA